MGLFKKEAERREYPRFTKNISIQINNRTYTGAKRLEDDPNGNAKPQKAMGENISIGGLCFVSQIPYEINSVLGLIIRIADLEEEKKRVAMYLAVSSIPIAAEGEVVRCIKKEDGSGYEIGIKFIDIYEDDHKILMKYLKD